MTRRTVLTTDDLLTKAPSIYATNAHAERSDKYSFVSTPQVLDVLRGEGWVPTQAVECRVRTKGGQIMSREGHQKHMIRLARLGDIYNQGNKKSILELVLRNSSDGTCKIQLDAGIFRLVCANGIVIQSDSFGGMKFKHMGLDMNDVVNATTAIVNEAPALMDTMGRWSGLQMSHNEQLTFAQSALAMRYGDEEAPVSPEAILNPRRWDDKSSDLWTTYNVIQEHLIKGGAKAWNRSGGGRRRSIRAVNSIDGGVELNKELWGLAETMEDLVTFKN